MKIQCMRMIAGLICAALLAGCAPQTAEPPAAEQEWPGAAGMELRPETGAEGRTPRDPLAETIALYREYCGAIRERFPGIELGETEIERFEAMLEEARDDGARMELGRQVNEAIAGADQRVFLYIENQRKMGNGEIEGAQEFLDEYAEKFARVDWTETE